MRFLSDITRYSYSGGELRKCLRTEDIWRFAIHGTASSTLTSKIDSCSETFYSGHFQVDKFRKINLRTKSIFQPTTLYDTLCIRRTNEILKNALHTTILNRDHEISQLLKVIKSEKECNIFKSDISSFYENVPFNDVIIALEKAGIRNNCLLGYLYSLNRCLINTFNYRGLPRGLSISSTLSDYFLRDFDRKILNSDDIIYYTRYVDDIFISHYQDKKKLSDFVKSVLPISLKLNKEKTYSLTNGTAQNLTFLGYTIALSGDNDIKVAESKISKTKKRIILSIRAFLKDGDFNLLISRIRFLSSTTEMRKVGRDALVYTGYRYVYRYCTTTAIVEQMNSLDKFLHGVLRSKRFYLSKALRNKLSPVQFSELKRISFKKSYEINVTNFIDSKDISKIKVPWQYE